MKAQQDVTADRPHGAARPQMVLDTNTVLDWLVFADNACLAFAHHISSGRVAWHATPEMRAELAHVLPRPALARRQPDAQRVLASFDRHVILAQPPEHACTSPPTTCKDPDDQKFIDLALAIGARWLLTRDRALLDLAAAARRAGVHVLRPADWVADAGP